MQMASIVTLDNIYFLTGLVLIIVSVYTVFDKGNPARYTTGAILDTFWADVHGTDYSPS